MRYVNRKDGEIITYYASGKVAKTRFYGSNYDPKTDRSCSCNIEIHFRDGRKSEVLEVFLRSMRSLRMDLRYLRNESWCSGRAGNMALWRIRPKPEREYGKAKWVAAETLFVITTVL